MASFDVAQGHLSYIIAVGVMSNVIFQRMMFLRHRYNSFRFGGGTAYILSLLGSSVTADIIIIVNVLHLSKTCVYSHHPLLCHSLFTTNNITA